MSSIKTLANIRTKTPSCSAIKRFYRCLELSGTQLLDDSGNGGVINLSSAMVLPSSSGGLNLYAGSSITYELGVSVLPDLTGLDWALVMLWKPQSGYAIRLGEAVENIGMGAASAITITGASGARVCGTLAGSTVLKKFAIINRVTAGAIAYQAIMGADLAAGGIAAADTTALGNLAPDNQVRLVKDTQTDFRNLHGVQLLTYAADSMPANATMLTAFDWEMERWNLMDIVASGNATSVREIYPGLCL